MSVDLMAAREVRRREWITGVPVDTYSMEEVVGRVAEAVAGGPRLRMLVANANKAWLARRDGRLRAALESADIVVPEWAMTWASARLGMQPVPFIGGYRVLLRLLEEAERSGWSAYFLGARPEVVEALVRRLSVTHPQLRIAGAHHGYLNDGLRELVRGDIRAAAPDLLFVAMGSPRQEYWIADEFEGLGARAALGVGGSFEVLAGVKRDAPGWTRGHGLEWLYRLAQDPWRLGRRYLRVNPWFLRAVARERQVGRRVRGPGSAADEAVGESASERGDWLSAALALDHWMKERDYAGHDPHDVLASPLVGALSLGSRWLAVAWTQVGKRLSLEARGALGVPALRNPKAMGLVLQSYVRLADQTDRAAFQRAGRELIVWLADARVRGERGGAGWGYPFPWANRVFYAPSGTPSGVVTGFVGHALLDVWDHWDLEDARDLAREGARFVVDSLQRVAGPGDSFAFSYTPRDRRVVHNANLIAASLVARVAALDRDEQLAAAALRATRFTSLAQRADGSWPYGEARRDDWVDSFHTGYVLLALDEIARRLALDHVDDVIARGIEYWRGAFFSGPAVGLLPGRAYPVETHAVAHAILTLLALRQRMATGARGVADPLVEAKRLGRWAIRELRDDEGFFYYRKGASGANRTAYLRWSQAWMLRALAELAVSQVAPR